MKQAIDVKQVQYDLYDKARRGIDAVPASGYHLYVHKGCIYSLGEWKEFVHLTDSLGKLYLDCSETDIKDEEFVLSLAEFESEQRSSRLLEYLKVCVPMNYPKDRLVSLAKDIAIEKFTGKEGVLPFFLRARRVGKSFYLYIIFSERYYYPEGKNVSKVRSSDFYRDSKTGRRCKQDDPNATLVWHKGEIVSSNTIYFSVKERFFRIEDHAFYGLLKAIKKIMKEFFEAYTPSEDSALFGRLSYDNLTSFSMKRKCRLVNRSISRCEQKASALLYAYEQAGFTDSTDALKEAIKQWRQLLLEESGSFTLVKHRIKYTINFRSPLKSFKDNLELMERRFNLVFDDFIKRMQQTDELMAVYPI